jgi:hypothetical protein
MLKRFSQERKNDTHAQVSQCYPNSLQTQINDQTAISKQLLEQ